MWSISSPLLYRSAEQTRQTSVLGDFPSLSLSSYSAVHCRDYYSQRLPNSASYVLSYVPLCNFFVLSQSASNEKLLWKRFGVRFIWHIRRLHREPQTDECHLKLCPMYENTRLLNTMRTQDCSLYYLLDFGALEYYKIHHPYNRSGNYFCDKSHERLVQSNELSAPKRKNDIPSRKSRGALSSRDFLKENTYFVFNTSLQFYEACCIIRCYLPFLRSSPPLYNIGQNMGKQKTTNLTPTLN